MDLKAYLDENYGTCAMDRCVCHKNGWMGTGCNNWKPFGVSTWEELIEAQKKIGSLV